jgi:hypothetical protein
VRRIRRGRRRAVSLFSEVVFPFPGLIFLPPGFVLGFPARFFFGLNLFFSFPE